jgi:DNA-binding NtrC family response regulator
MSAAESGDAPIRVLLVDDDEDDCLITREMLARQQRARFSVEWCPGYDEALRTIAEGRHDVYLIDYRLDGHTGLDLVREGFAGRAHVPVLMLTGQSAYEIDVAAAALGVSDFLVKQELEPVMLERAIGPCPWSATSWPSARPTTASGTGT